MAEHVKNPSDDAAYQRSPGDNHASAALQATGMAAPAVVADRAGGVLVGQACGDALGVPYEFASPRLTGKPRMIGGGIGGYEPGEWSDDTQLSVCLAEIASTGADLTEESSLDAISVRYIAALSTGVSELDAQTQVVLDSVLYDEEPGRPAQKMRRAAAFFHRRTQRSAASGALARTPIVGLTRVMDEEWTAESARAVAELTHVDPVASDACIIVSEAIRAAVIDPVVGQETWRRRLHFDRGVALLPKERRRQWVEWLGEAARRHFKPPMDNTFSVSALQAAIGAIVHASSEPGATTGTQAFRMAVEYAVQTGGDTDTIAAITGAIMGAAVGASALPAEWVGVIHGWPGLQADGLQDLAVGTAMAGILGQESMATLIERGVDVRGYLEGRAPGLGGER